MAESTKFTELKPITSSHITENPTPEDIDKANELFSIMTKLQKSDGNMFLFGKITKNIFDAIERIYHENLARVTSGVDEISRPGFMLGILEDKNGTIYMAISEDQKEDSNFMSKIQSLYAMLTNANFHVIIPEQEVQSYLEHGSNYRQSSSRNPLTNRLMNTMLPSLVSSNKQPSYTSDMKNKLANVPKFVKNKGSDYYKENTIPVHLINSENYLSERRRGIAYPPIKKLKYDKKFFLECNNGSTCVEAKLFSYFYDNFPELKFEDIKGFAAYWVAKDLPPKHYMAKYSYCKQTDPKHGACKSQDDEKLTTITKIILTNVDKTYSDADLEIYKTILQPLALSCPGCLLNFSNYKNNRRSRFNYESCAPNTISYADAKTLGGSYKSKLRKNVRNKQSKKRKNTLRIHNKVNYKSKKKHNNK